MGFPFQYSEAKYMLLSHNNIYLIIIIDLSRTIKVQMGLMISKNYFQL